MAETHVVPRCPVTIRPAVAADLPFIDSLQKQHTHAVGWMPTKQLEGKIAAGHVLVAEDAGYCIARDQYFKRDDVGIVYQLNVATEKQRGLVGAALLKAVFERAAYGCRLFCCWCAQDIEANYFWEAMGFVPLAYRAGSEKKSRVHVFWQKRIREGDAQTPWWFPAKTDAGAMREDRLVLPIPPGKHWSDEMPVLVQEGANSLTREGAKEDGRRVPGSKHGPRTPTPKPRAKARFGPPGPPVAQPVVVENVTPESKKPAKAKREKQKCDPKLVAAARELRDRYLEHVNADPSVLLSEGKYDLSRRIEHREAEPERRLLAG